jgi:hypothetical protein
MGAAPTVSSASHKPSGPSERCGLTSGQWLDGANASSALLSAHVSGGGGAPSSVGRQKSSDTSLLLVVVVVVLLLLLLLVVDCRLLDAENSARVYQVAPASVSTPQPSVALVTGPPPSTYGRSWHVPLCVLRKPPHWA